MTEALLLDRQFHPDARRLWDALLERADGADADKVDDVLRGEIATERASRAHLERNWDAVNAFFLEAAACYERAGRPDRVIASGSAGAVEQGDARGCGMLMRRRSRRRRGRS